MVVFYLEALAAIAVALSVPMAGAWAVQLCTGNPGWAWPAPPLDIRDFPLPPQKGAI
jgi:hypothetical protein